MHYHIDRLKEGVQRLNIHCDLPGLIHELTTIIDDVSSSKSSDTYLLKIIVSRGESDFGYATSGLRANRTVIVKPFPVASARSLRLAECKLALADQRLLAGIKHCNRLEQILAKQEIECLSGDIDDGILYDAKGNVIETTSANIFLIKGGQLLTPKLDRCGVAGVMRAYIMQELCPRLGISVSEDDISRKRLYEADALFVSNAVFGVRPVVACNDYTWPIHDIFNIIDDAIVSMMGG